MDVRECLWGEGWRGRVCESVSECMWVCMSVCVRVGGVSESVSE